MDNIHQYQSTNKHNKKCEYRETYNISHTISQNLNDSRLGLQLSLYNPLRPGVMSRMAMLQLHLSDQQFYFQLRWGLY